MSKGTAFRFSALSWPRAVSQKFPFALSIIALLACVAFMAPAASAQTNGQISGAVTDQAGAAVAGATVTVRRPATGQTRVVQTTDSGTYTVPDLPAGNYTVTVTRDGFRETVVSAVTVNTSSITTQNVVLEIGEAIAFGKVPSVASQPCSR